jgi:hypothetical protein
VIVSTMILVCSLAFFLLYIQGTCETILKREFDPVRLGLAVTACRFEFQFVQKEIANPDADYVWARMALKCDYKMLKYLMKESGKVSYSRRERLLMAYFNALSFIASVQHAAKLNEKATILKLTRILTFFANLLGERTGQIEFAALTR